MSDMKDLIDYLKTRDTKYDERRNKDWRLLLAFLFLIFALYVVTMMIWKVT